MTIFTPRLHSLKTGIVFMFFKSPVPQSVIWYRVDAQLMEGAKIKKWIDSASTLDKMTRECLYS